MVRVSMSIPSGYASVDAMDNIVGELLKLAGYDEDERHRMSVCVREAAVNAHKHGNREDGSKRMSMDFEYGDNATVYIGDEGTEEFRTEEHLALKDDLLRPDGRGVFFMGQFTDEPPSVEYVMRDGSISPKYEPGMVVGKRIRLVKYAPVTSSR